MKKAIIIASIVALVFLIAGGVFLYVMSTPVYALVRTIEDVNSDGLNGLKKHLTERANNDVEAIEDMVDAEVISDAISSVTTRYAVRFLKSKLSETEWAIDDVLKGNNQTDVIIRFNYKNRITGTIAITMVKVERRWKIDGLSFPRFEVVALW